MTRETVLALYEFIGVIMALPHVKDKELYQEIKQTSEEKQMSVLAVAERIGLEKGIEQKSKELKNMSHDHHHEDERSADDPVTVEYSCLWFHRMVFSTKYKVQSIKGLVY